MLAHESAAREAFTHAEQGLQKAMASYSEARALRAVTGDTLLRDERVSLKFSTANGTERAADVVLTDC